MTTEFALAVIACFSTARAQPVRADQCYQHRREVKTLIAKFVSLERQQIFAVVQRLNRNAQRLHLLLTERQRLDHLCEGMNHPKLR